MMTDEARSTRRQVLSVAARAALVLGAGSVLPANDQPLPIIDTHQHLWDLKRFRLPWLDNAGPELKRDFVMADYLKAAEGLNVARAVYMEVAVAPGQRQAEAEWVIDLCRHGGAPTVAAVIGGSPASNDFAAYIGQFKESPYVKGVRESLRRGSSSDSSFRKGIQFLGELGMSFDLLHGPDLLAESATLAKACPDTRFILDHCGNADARDFRPGADEAAKHRRKEWEDGIAQLAERPNVICKISGVVESAARNDALDKPTPDDLAPVVNRCLDRFGPDRVIFASNWPVCNRGGSFGEWVRLLSPIVAPRSAIDRRKLFHDNAMRFYSLK